MKKTIYLTAFVAMLFLSSCWDNSFWTNDYYSTYKPVLMERAELEKSVTVQPARQMCATGKIYFKDDYIYIVEKYQGIHVIDNSNPSSPENQCFIYVPGSVDMAMKNNVIYVDNARDLVAIDISNGASNMKITKREKNVFPELVPPDGLGLRPEFQEGNRPANTVIIGWEEF